MNPNQLRRRAATCYPLDRVLIVGSSDLHKEYSRWLLRHLDHHPGTFSAVQADSAPVDVLSAAASLARQQRAMGSACQQVWALLDGVDAEDVPELKKAAKAANVKVAVSTPDFETWLMLHIAELPESPSETALVSALHEYDGIFSSPFHDYEGSLAGRFEVAKARAIALSDGPIRSDAYRLVDGVLSSIRRYTGRPYERAV